MFKISFISVIRVIPVSFSHGPSKLYRRFTDVIPGKVFFLLEPLNPCFLLLESYLRNRCLFLPAVPEAGSLSCVYRHLGIIDQVCAIPTQPGSTLSDNLFTADLLVERHAPATLVVSNAPAEHRLGPVHPWLEEAPS